MSIGQRLTFQILEEIRARAKAFGMWARCTLGETLALGPDLSLSSLVDDQYHHLSQSRGMQPHI